MFVKVSLALEDMVGPVRSTLASQISPGSVELTLRGPDWIKIWISEAPWSSPGISRALQGSPGLSGALL
eukprot:6825901-Alexandrium_andersonii.AAC.1